MNKRLPPQAIEAEENILGTMMLGDQKETLQAISSLVAEDFYKPAHAEIFSVMRALFSAGESIDLVTVANAVRAAGKIEMVGGVSYLSGLTETIPFPGLVNRYAPIIKEKAAARKIISLSEKMMHRCYRDERVKDITEDFGKDFFNIVTDRAKGARHISAVVKDVKKEINNTHENGVQVGIPTGFIDLDNRWNGMQRGEMILMAGRPSMGKELTLCSKVLGCDGTFKLMGEIMVGDKLASIDGKDSFVTGVFPQGIKPVYRVTFSDGRSVKAGLDHQWKVMFREWDCPRILTTRELIEKIKIKRYQKRLSIPNHSGDFGEDKNLLIHPYLMGVLLGDGGLSGSSVKITTSHSHIIEKIKPMLLDALLVKDQKITYRISTPKGSYNKLHSSIKEMGLMGLRSHEKFIPDRYLSATKESRLELLRGLIDTDGTVEKTGAMTFTTTSVKLAKQTQAIARSLGASCSMRERITEYSYKGERRKGKISYTIYISCDHYGDFVTVPHKKERVVAKKRNKNIIINSIEYIGEYDCQCISVDHHDCLYIADEYTVTHNTALAMNIASNVAFAGYRVLVFSLEMKDKGLVQRMMSTLSAISSDGIRKGNLPDEHLARVMRAGDVAADLGVWIDETAGLSLSDLSARAKMQALKNGVDLIVVDYLQLMKAPGENRTQEVSTISQGLKNLAKDLDVPVLALSQLNRGLANRTDKRPVLTDLRESGSLEQDADVIAMIHRDDYYNRDHDNPNRGIAEVITAKHRNGPTGTDNMLFQGEFSKFLTMEQIRRQGNDYLHN